MKAAFYTLGCKVNQYDTQVMIDTLAAHGYEIVPFESVADVYIINSCTVTGTGGKKSRNACMRARRANPEAIVCLTGCLAQAEEISPALADVVAGVSDRAKIHEYIKQAAAGRQISAVSDVSRADAFDESVSAAPFERTRAHLKIQEGCSNFCAYCIVPYVRGNPRSRSLDSVRAAARELVRAGYNEIVLTGINLSSYAADTGGGLANAVRAVCETGVKRLRLGSLEPHIITEAFLKTIAGNPAVCPHFHLSLQSGCDATLQRMGRRYSAGEYARRVDMIRSVLPDAGITTDMIVGFPGETRDDFEASARFAGQMGFSRVHVFPYSRRKGTRAYDMPEQIPRSEKEERARALIAVGERLENRFASGMIGREVSVLVEQTDGAYAYGYTPNYVWARVDGAVKVGEILTARVYAADGNIALAKTLS